MERTRLTSLLRFGRMIRAERGHGGGGGGLRRRALDDGCGGRSPAPIRMESGEGVFRVDRGRVLEFELPPGFWRRSARFQRAHAVDDLQKRVVDRLEGLGVALIGAPRQRLPAL